MVMTGVCTDGRKRDCPRLESKLNRGVRGPFIYCSQVTQANRPEEVNWSTCRSDTFLPFNPVVSLIPFLDSVTAKLQPPHPTIRLGL